MFDFMPAPDADFPLKGSCSLDELPWLLRANRNSSRRSCCSAMQCLLPVIHTRKRRYINKKEHTSHYCSFIYASSLPSAQLHETSSQWLLLHVIFVQYCTRQVHFKHTESRQSIKQQIRLHLRYLHQTYIEPISAWKILYAAYTEASS